MCRTAMHELYRQVCSGINMSLLTRVILNESMLGRIPLLVAWFHGTLTRSTKVNSTILGIISFVRYLGVVKWLGNEQYHR